MKSWHVVGAAWVEYYLGMVVLCVKLTVTDGTH